MLSLELCRKLRDCGYPQDCEFKVYSVSSPSAAVNAKDYYAHKSEDLDLVEVQEIIGCPTLSELIEACADKFGSLSRFVKGEFGKDFWLANPIWPDGELAHLRDKIIGETPEEAVCNLWLALHAPV